MSKEIKGQSNLSKYFFHSISANRQQDVEGWLQAGASMELRNEYGQDPLAVAVQNGAVDVVKFFLNEKNVDPDQAQHGLSAVHLAVLYNQFAVLKCLKEHGAKMSLPDRSGITPLQMALGYGYFDLCQLFDLSEWYKKTPTGRSIVDISSQIFEKRSKRFMKVFQRAIF